MKIIEKPFGNIVQGQSFKIVFEFEIKQTQNNFTFSIKKESPNNGNGNSDIINKREIEIEEIGDKIEVNSKNVKNCIALNCKAENLGNVKLPKIKVTMSITDGNNNRNNKVLDFVYDELISFNCIANIQLI